MQVLMWLSYEFNKYKFNRELVSICIRLHVPAVVFIRYHSSLFSIAICKVGYGFAVETNLEHFTVINP
jgi:hypothetical protein